MKSSHIGLICIVMISLFALRECKDNCWCCNKLIDRYKSVCWREKDTPSAKELCFAFCPKDVKPSMYHQK
ncbi:hypothetical protein BRARA_D01025 [Brassica rapa]|uniref:Embryo surrounding factor 1 brassicaceae domain-containing protein n=1 Tax=Brassica campestris TaxID=3711 RepID=A0A397ZJN6_BRACM|nr:hypothetical protein BRARA_D01025 [Brassica rapa]